MIENIVILILLFIGGFTVGRALQQSKKAKKPIENIGYYKPSSNKINIVEDFSKHLERARKEAKDAPYAKDKE